MEEFDEDELDFFDEDPEVVVRNAEQNAISLIRGFYIIMVTFGIMSAGIFFVMSFIEISDPYTIEMHNTVSHIITNENAASLELLTGISILIALFLVFKESSLLFYGNVIFALYLGLIWLQIVIKTGGMLFKVDVLSIIGPANLILGWYVSNVVKDTLLDVQRLRQYLQRLKSG